MGCRPIIFDVTHLVSRLNHQATTGIDRVDLGYARFFVGRKIAAVCTHYGAFRPHIFSQKRARRLVHEVARDVGDSNLGNASEWTDIRDWLCGQALQMRGMAGTAPPHSPKRFLRQSALRVVSDPPFFVPKNAIYLNVAQSGFEHPQMFRWLNRRADVTTAFLVHDLLPLDIPSMFRPGYSDLFARRVDTIVRHSDAIICASTVVRDRLLQEYHRRGGDAPPIGVFPFASPLGGRAMEEERDAELIQHPYFVMLGTLEPRKGHALLLDVWEQLPREKKPKLVLVGAPGWGIEETMERISTSCAVENCVIRLSGLSRRTLRRLLVNARALLLPSLAEGYGLPIAEALSLGTPVIASDIPAFDETSQSKAELVAARNTGAWRQAVEDFCDQSSPRWKAAKMRANEYQAPTRERYFRDVKAFLEKL